MSDFCSDPSSTSILHVGEQRRLWRDCADAQAHLSLRWSPITRNVGLVTDIPTAEYLSAWQVLGNLEIAEVLRDYVASSPQREQICLFLSSWLGISK